MKRQDILLNHTYYGRTGRMRTVVAVGVEHAGRMDGVRWQYEGEQTGGVMTMTAFASWAERCMRGPQEN